MTERIISVALGALVGAALVVFGTDMLYHSAEAAPRNNQSEIREARISVPQFDIGIDLTPPEFEDHITTSQADLHCMAHAIYYEARGERFVGMLAVANVILNRSQDPDYPNTICGVTRQRTRNICQFEYYCKVGNRVPPANDPQWQMANDIAMHVMSGNLPDITDGAIRFHAVNGSSPQRNALRIGSHLFYRR